MDLTEAERDLTSFFAEKLNLAIDSQIFRGQIPEGFDGIAVRIDSMIDSNVASPLTCNVQLIGKFPDRDDGLNFVGKVPFAVPCWNVQLEHVCIKSLFFRGSGTVYQDTDAGVVKNFVSINLVAVLTA